MNKTLDVILLAGNADDGPLYKNYVITNSLVESDGKVILGDKTQPICRFCGKGSPYTTFNKKAHIIPEFMGNKLFFSNYECDICNDRIGNLEDSLFNLAGIFNSLSTVKGKRGHPKFKDKKNGMEIFADDFHSVVTRIESKDSDCIICDKEKGTMKFDVNQPGYVPQDAFKSLVKIALLMMPEDEFKNYHKAIEWLNSTNIKGQENNPLFCVFRKVGGKKRFIQPWAVLFQKKKSESLNSFPHHSLLLFYGILQYQIFLPFHKEDEDLLKKDKIHLALSQFVIKVKKRKQDSVELGIDRVPLGGADKIKSEREKFSFSLREKE